MSSGCEIFCNMKVKKQVKRNFYTLHSHNILSYFIMVQRRSQEFYPIFTIYQILEDFVKHNFCCASDIYNVHPNDSHRPDSNMQVLHNKGHVYIAECAFVGSHMNDKFYRFYVWCTVFEHVDDQAQEPYTQHSAFQMCPKNMGYTKILKAYVNLWA